MTVLTVKNLSITAETPLVKNVSFSIDAGEILALVGESGSGKTLTALSISHLLPAGITQMATYISKASSVCRCAGSM